MSKILIVLFLSLSLVQPAFAQSPTNANEIQKIREVIQQKVKEKLDQLKEPVVQNPKKAYLGTITEITDTKISIDTKNQIKEFTLADDSVYIGSKQTKIKKTDLKIGQDVLILSLSKDTLFFAKRIIITDPKAIENHKTIVLGKIADISQTSSVFVLIPTNNKNRELQIKLTSKTEILTKDNKKLTDTDLQKGQKIICIYDSSQSPTFPALQIINLDK